MSYNKNKKIDTIKSVLKEGGALDFYAIHSRVEAKLLIKYAAKSCQRHLKELADRGEVFVTQEGNRLVYSKEFDGFDVQGKNYLRSIGAQIFVPPALKIAGVKINAGLFNNKSINELFLVLEFGGNYLSLSVHTDALPFNIHISRLQSEIDNKPDYVKEHFGSRTITLELPHIGLSRIKPDIPTSGHALMEFDGNGNLNITDLDSTNGTSTRTLSQDATQTIFKIINNLGIVRTQFSSEQVNFKNEAQFEKLQPHVKKISPLPTQISSSNFNLVIYKNPDPNENLRSVVYKESLKAG